MDSALWVNAERVILFEEQGKWICHGVDVDTAAQADTKEDALWRFMKTRAIERALISGGAPDIAEPPQVFRDRWYAAVHARQTQP